MNIQPTKEQIIHKINHETDQKNAENIIQATVKIAQIAFDYSIAGWLEDTLPKIVRSYVIGAWHNNETSDPKELALIAIKAIRDDFVEQLNDSIAAIE
jgi:uncharacterized protein (DUF2267 family)